MGVASSGPFVECNIDIENDFESFVNSISTANHETSTPLRPISFSKMDLERILSANCTSSDSEMCKELEIMKPEHEAAIKLQKVYKSFRTRRKLADCAVLIEQSWWKLIDFVELKHSSISFFDIEKHETAISRWSRARTRAAKVGKGLSKNGKAQKLALQHWLEAIDPRHRYGHNLHFYYKQWLDSQSKEPFFYWLDIGEGKEVNLVEKCPRLKLQQQCIKYLGPMERIAYEVIIEDGKFYFKQSGKLLNTTGDAKWIFVLSTSKTLYVGQKKKGSFQHSSFLAGGATIAAGRLVVEDGVLNAVWPHSGHYRPTEENFKDFVSFLEENNVDLTDVKMTPVDEEESQRSSKHIRSSSSEVDLARLSNSLEPEEINVKDSAQEETNSTETASSTALDCPESRRIKDLSKKLTNLEIPKRDDLFEGLQFKSSDTEAIDSPTEEVPTTSEAENSYQLGKQLSCRWTTGAGPRIGCVREYPSKLQVQALEHVHLSPRSAGLSKSYFSPRSGSCFSPKVSSSPSRCSQEMTANFGSPVQRRVYRTQSSPFMKEGFLGTVASVS